MFFLILSLFLSLKTFSKTRKNQFQGKLLSKDVILEEIDYNYDAVITPIACFTSDDSMLMLKTIIFGLVILLISVGSISWFVLSYRCNVRCLRHRRRKSDADTNSPITSALI